MLVSGLKSNLFSSLAAATKGVRTILEKNDSSLDLGPFEVQLTQLDNVDHLNLTIAKERTESSLCAISGKKFDKISAITALVSKKPVALSVGSINFDQRVVVNASIDDKSNNSTYKTHNTKEDVSFCENRKVMFCHLRLAILVKKGLNSPKSALAY